MKVLVLILSASMACSLPTLWNCRGKSGAR